jgi:eukaryotic-like serine/threonine-protein kinase
LPPPEDLCNELHERCESAYLARHFEEALGLAREARAKAEAALGPRHPAIARAHLDEALALRALGNSNAAEKAASDAQALLETLATDPRTEIRTALALFEGDRLAATEPDEAIARYTEALALCATRNFAREAYAAFKLADALYAAGRSEQALPHYERALLLGADAYWGARASTGYAMALAERGRNEEAISAYARALALAERQPLETRVHYFLLIAYRDALRAAGRNDEAERFDRRAQALLPTANPGAAGFQPS